MCQPLDSVLACGKCVSPDYFMTEKEEKEESRILRVRKKVRDNLNDQKVQNVQICLRYGAEYSEEGKP